MAGCCAPTGPTRPPRPRIPLAPPRLAAPPGLAAPPRLAVPPQLGAPARPAVWRAPADCPWFLAGVIGVTRGPQSAASARWHQPNPQPGSMCRCEGRRPAGPLSGRALQDELVNVEVAGTETGLGVGEVEVPHPPEGRAEAQPGHLAVGGGEPGAPLLERARVVRPHGQIGDDAQRRTRAQGIADGLQ